MTSWIKPVDARIQSAVDHFAFLVMRTFNVGKSFVRYAVFALWASTVIVSFCLPPSYEQGVSQKAVAGIILFSLLVRMHMGYREDIRADEDGSVASLHDNPKFEVREKIIYGSVILLSSLVAIMNFMHFTGEQLLRYMTVTSLSMTFGLCGLTVAYLTKTPRRPPPRKERRTSAATQPTES